jgi:hypothetical protein
MGDRDRAPRRPGRGELIIPCTVRSPHRTAQTRYGGHGTARTARKSIPAVAALSGDVRGRRPPTRDTHKEAARGDGGGGERAAHATQDLAPSAFARAIGYRGHTHRGGDQDEDHADARRSRWHAPRPHPSVTGDVAHMSCGAHARRMHNCSTCHRHNTHDTSAPRASATVVRVHQHRRARWCCRRGGVRIRRAHTHCVATR